jgi:uncharacterized repeat protein (TIGR01451 family)
MQNQSRFLTSTLKPLLSVSLGLTLLCGALLLLNLARPVAAAPAPPKFTAPPPPPQALVVVTSTIQEAINAANPGDTVEFTGTYTEEVIINKSLTLQGSTPTSAIVYDGSISPPVSPTIQITTDAVTITNMTLKTVGFLDQNAIVVNNSSDVLITGVTIQDYPTGIEFQRTGAGPTAITITNNIIQSSAGSSEPGIFLLGIGAGIGAIQAVIQSNQVSGHAISINAEGLAPTLISSNILTTTGDSFDGAIRVNQAGASLIENNTLIVTAPVASTTLTGIYLGNSANPTVTQNIIDPQFTFGLETNDTAAPVITNSLISGHSGAGIRVNGSSTPQVLHNSITSNLNGISVGSLSALVTASGNTICQNSSFGLRSSATFPDQPAIGNWWGHNPPLDSDTIAPSDYRPNVDASSPISMALALNPTPTLIALNGSAAITLTMAGGGFNVLDGTAISFSAGAGSFVTTNTTTLNGLANTSYVGSVLGTHVITAADSCGGVVTATVTVGEPVLTATKTADPLPGASVQPGQTITYTIYVTNTGGFTATGVVFSDTIPAFTQLATASVDSGVINVSDPISATFNPIAPNGVMSVTVQVTVTLPLTNGIVLTNTGAVSYFNGSSSVITTTNAVTHVVASSPSLTYTKFADPPAGSSLTLSLSPPTQITYTIVVTNEGNANATGLTITDTLPADTSGAGLTPWSPGFLAGAGGVVSNTFVVTVNVPLPDLTVITNVYEVSFDQAPGVVFTNSSTLSPTNVVTHLIRSAPLVTATKTAIPPDGSVVAPGDRITYTLTITNSGSANATNTVLTDTIPQFTQYVAGSASPAPLSTNPPVWNLGIIPGLGGVVSATFAVQVNTPLTSGLIISNSAVLDIAETTGLSSTNFVTHTVVSTPVLSLDKSADPPGGSGVFPGQTITYTIAVTNSGNGPATGFQITDTAPAEVNLVTIAGVTPGFSAISGTNTITVNGVLAVGQAMNVTFVVTVSTAVVQGTIISNTAFVGYAESPVISATNTVTHVVQTTPVITLTKSAQPPGPFIDAGQAITYTIVVSNGGALDGNNVVVTDFIPANTNFVGGSFTSTIGTLSGPDPLQVTIPTLMAGQLVTVTFQVTVTTPLTNGVVISNQAQLSADFLSAMASNSVTHTVVSTPQLTLTKTNLPTNTVTPGSPLVYFLTLRNDGAGNATNVVISDTLPANTSVSFHFAPPPTATSTISGSTWQVTIPSLPGGGTTADNILLILTVDRPLTNGLVITNVASFISDQTPLTTSNVVTNIVQSQPVLLITKSADPPSGSAVNPGDPITYTIVVEHDLLASTENAPNVVITDMAPLNTNFVAGSDNLAGGVNPTSAFTAPNVIGRVDLLPYGEVMTLTYVVTVTQPLTDGVIISNIAFVDSDRTLPTFSSPQVTHTVQSQIDLTFYKEATPPPGPINPGDVITYTITLTNSGSADATGLVITDVVPTYTIYLPGSAASSGSASESGGVVNFGGSVPGLGGLFTATFAVSVTSPLTNGLNIVNVAQFTTDQTGVISQTNSVTHTVVASPVLTLTKSADPPGGPINPGDMITYTLNVVNNGTAGATGVVITDLLDANLNFVDANPAQSGGPNPLLFNVGALAGNGGAVTYTVRVTVTTPLTNGVMISNAAQVASTETPTPTTSNAVTHTVVASANLSITKLASPVSGTQVDPGSGINYTIVVVNTGNAPATNLVITDALPISTTFFSSQLVPPIGSIVGPDPLVATIPSLPGNGGAVMFLISINVMTNAQPGLVITNAAQMVSNETAITDTNVTTHVVKAPDLAISKVADPPGGASINPGDPITYTVTVTNVGPVAATGVVVTDTLDANVNFISATPAQSSGPNPLVFNAGTLLSSEVVSYTIRVTATTPLSAGVVLSNMAQADSNETAVATSTVVTHVISTLLPNLTIIKSADPVGGSAVNPGDSITYTLTVTNTGPGSATGVVITDLLDANVNFNNASPAQSSGPNPLVFNAGALLSGQSVSYTVRVTVTSPLSNGVIISNAAQAASTETPTATSSNVVTHTVTAVPSLSIVKLAAPASGSFVNPGDPIVYFVQVQNNGTAAATNLTITDTLPISTVFSFEQLTPPTGTVSGPDPLVVNIPSLAGGGGTVLFRFVVTVTNSAPNGLIIPNQAQVSSNEVAITTTNVVTHEVGTPPPPATLAISKIADPVAGSTISAGSAVTYTIVVTNTGSATQTNLNIVDILDSNTTLVFSATSPAVSVFGSNPVFATWPSVAAGQSVTLTLGVNVAGALPNGTIITNSATGSSSESGSVGSGPVTHTIGSVLTPSLVITKTATPASGSPVSQGTPITYTITVQNNGAATATSVLISDTLDANVTLVNSATTTGTLSGPNPLQVSGFNLAAGESVTVTLAVSVTGNISGTIINNTASVTSPNSAALQASNLVTHVITSTTPAPSLAITKSASPSSGSAVTPGSLINYTLTVTNSGGSAGGFVLTDSIPSGAGYVSGSGSASFGTVNFNGSQVVVSAPTFTGGLTLTATFQISVTTNLTTTLTNQASIDSDQTTVQSSNVVTHAVQGTAPSGGVFLPIIYKDFDGGFAVLQWDNVEPVRDKVRNLDDGAGICFTPSPCDGLTDGVFRLTVNIGTPGPKVVTNIRLISTQGVEWDTITPNANPALAIVNGGSPLNNANGTINGVLFNSGLVIVQLYAADDAGFTRFPVDTYTYTVIINFADGTSLQSSTKVF